MVVEVGFMFIKMLKSKLHRATVTDTKLHYAGSIAVDSELMETVGLLPYEDVLIANVTNGNRFETYIVPAEAGSRKVVVMGAAAHLTEPKDIIIIFSMGYYDRGESRGHKPSVVALDENNKIIKRMS